MLCPNAQKTASIPGAEASLKICLLGYRSAPFSGGQGIYIKYLSKALSDLGHRVDVISGPPYPDLAPAIHLIKLPSLDLFAKTCHIRAIKPRHLLSFTDFFEWFSMLTGGFAEPYTFGRRLQKYFRQHAPDYDIVHDNQSLCYGTLGLQRQNIPLITTIHHPITSDLKIALANADNWKSRLLLRRWHSFLHMQKKVAAKLHHVVTVSEAARTDIAAAFGIPAEQMHVVHNGIATEVFRPLPHVERIPLRVMVTASADQPLKGMKYLLRAIALLAPKYPAIKLMILGKLNENGATEQLINSLDIGKHLLFVSNIATEQLVEYYGLASVVVVPSIYEGFGLPAGEAMSCGVPVISTNGGALAEVVGDAGIIVGVRDHHAIAEKIAYLFEDSKARQALSISGRKRIVESFSWPAAARDMVKLYRYVLNPL